MNVPATLHGGEFSVPRLRRAQAGRLDLDGIAAERQLRRGSALEGRDLRVAACQDTMQSSAGRTLAYVEAEADADRLVCVRQAEKSGSCELSVASGHPVNKSGETMGVRLP